MSLPVACLPWVRPCVETLVDRGLYFLVIRRKLIAGVFVYHAKPRKFYWDEMTVSLGEVDYCLFKGDLDATIPALNPVEQAAMAGIILQKWPSLVSTEAEAL